MVMQEGGFERYWAEAGKAHGPPCQRCALRPTCPGVWEGYIESHGWAELEPVLAAHEQVLRVRVGAACLNRCQDCLDGPGAQPVLPVPPVPPVAQQLAQGLAEGYRRVLLVGGDPLLDPQLAAHLE